MLFHLVEDGSRDVLVCDPDHFLSIVVSLSVRWSEVIENMQSINLQFPDDAIHCIDQMDELRAAFSKAYYEYEISGSSGNPPNIRDICLFQEFYCIIWRDIRDASMRLMDELVQQWKRAEQMERAEQMGLVEQSEKEENELSTITTQITNEIQESDPVLQAGPFADNCPSDDCFASPYMFRKSGTLIYSVWDNPYETEDVYLDLEPDWWVVKSYISEHGPDGISSWHGIFIDEQNRQKFESAVGENMEVFLRKYLCAPSKPGLIGFSKLLNSYEIVHTSKYAF